jgi:hypothetical protein
VGTETLLMFQEADVAVVEDGQQRWEQRGLAERFQSGELRWPKLSGADNGQSKSAA